MLKLVNDFNFRYIRKDFLGIIFNFRYIRNDFRGIIFQFLIHEK